MYLSHYNLREKPFKINPDPRFLWLGETHKEALATLKYGILENKGFKVLAASNGMEAVEKFSLNAGEISAVLMDLIMPGMSGEDAAKQIRSIRDDTSIIFTTGYHDLEPGELSGGAGITEMLYKPYKMKALVEKINEVISRTA